MLSSILKAPCLYNSPGITGKPHAVFSGTPGEASPPLPDRLVEFLRVGLSVKERRP